MKAFLLSAGIGSRLRPLTDNLPKCMVPIGGKPLIDYWFDLFERHGVNDVLVNTHYLHEKVYKHIQSYKGLINIKVFYEHNLLGSFGTILANKNFYNDGDDFLIVYADNYSTINISSMIQFHNQNKSSFTMGLFRCSTPTECGIASLDKQFNIVKFAEKPKFPESNLANAGIYITNKKVIESVSIPSCSPIDIGFHLLPQLKKKMKGYEIPEFLIDIGTMENYLIANNKAMISKTE